MRVPTSLVLAYSVDEQGDGAQHNGRGAAGREAQVALRTVSRWLHHVVEADELAASRADAKRAAVLEYYLVGR